MILRRFMQHFREQNWFAVGLDVLVVIVGILIALAIDEWRQDRADRALELKYIQNLINDLNTDKIILSDYKNNILSQKRKVLETIGSFNEVPDELDAFLINIENLDYAGYQAIPAPNNTTFREVENSSHFRLIEDDDLRKAISLYYEQYQQNFEILSNPLGRYKILFAETFPGHIYIKTMLREDEISHDVVREWLNTLISHPESKAAINAELYYTTDQIYWINAILEKGEALTRSLKMKYQ